jgi:hypothetical protein
MIVIATVVAVVPCTVYISVIVMVAMMVADADAVGADDHVRHGRRCESSSG